MTRNHRSKGLLAASIFEATKGVLVLTTGLELTMFIHKDLHLVAEQIVQHLHFNPASHYPHIFINALTGLNDWELWLLALSAFLYAAVRFVEAYGLWYERQWAEWFGFLTGGMYIPLELLEIIRGVTWAKLTILIINTFIVVVLACALIRSRHINNQSL
jgi:uncharacterized membrane protein (DUF2068 family)